MTSDAPEPGRKAQIDAVLLKLPGVVAKKINGLDAYFVGDRMFACISGGVASTREWVRINRTDAAEYAQDLPSFQASIDFVRAARGR